MRYPLLRKLNDESVVPDWDAMRVALFLCFALAGLLSYLILRPSPDTQIQLGCLLIAHAGPAACYVLASLVGRRSVKKAAALIVTGFMISLVFTALLDPNSNHEFPFFTLPRFSSIPVAIYLFFNLLVVAATVHAFVSLKSPKLDIGKANVILIGMPGAGKTTIGQLYAKKAKLSFVDTDRLIEQSTGRSLQDIVDNDGYKQLREIEAKCLLELDCTHSLISTGGSAVYSHSAMKHLASLGTIVYLSLPLSVLRQRIGDHSERGLAKPKEQTLAQLYDERRPLYEAYADRLIDCEGLTPGAVCDLLEAVVKSRTKFVHSRGLYER